MIVFAGSGRSGTGYISTVMRAAGCEIGHEELFNVHGPTQGREGLVGDSSWMSVPYLNEPVLEDELKVLVFREPELVISSFYSINFFQQPSLYRQFVYSHLPELRELDPFEACCEYYVLWNEWALQSVDFVWNINDPHWLDVADEAGLTMQDFASAIPMVLRTYNSRQREHIPQDRFPKQVYATYKQMEEASHER